MIKSFNTILNSRKTKSGRRYKTENTPKPKLSKKKLPKEFSPFTSKWGAYLSPIQDQGLCGSCYSQATVSSLADRFSLLTNGYFKPILSAYEPVVCNGVISSKIDIDKKSDELQVKMFAHSSAACTGNTIENIMGFLYAYGTVDSSCFELGILKKYGLNLESTIKTPNELPYCSEIIGKKYNYCTDRKTIARFFRCVAYYEVYPEIEYIKQEIYRWGPVVSGMIVYESFLKEYDGNTIYMGPKNDKDNEEGGHAIRIVGWGTENNIPYWLVANSWGVDWGLKGYFKIKMGVCDIEKNVMALIPDIEGFPLHILDYTPIVDQILIEERRWFSVDNITGYRNEYLNLLSEDPEPIVDKKLLPNYTIFWAGEISIPSPQPTKFILNNISKNQNRDKTSLFIVILFIIIPITLAYILRKIIISINK